MKIETQQVIRITHEEYMTLLKCHELLCDMARDSTLNSMINNEILPCGFCVEDLRDGIGYIMDDMVAD
jgi:hypothetical protein